MLCYGVVCYGMWYVTAYGMLRLMVYYGVVCCGEWCVTVCTMLWRVVCYGVWYVTVYCILCITVYCILCITVYCILCITVYCILRITVYSMYRSLEDLGCYEGAIRSHSPHCVPSRHSVTDVNCLCTQSSFLPAQPLCANIL